MHTIINGESCHFLYNRFQNIEIFTSFASLEIPKDVLEDFTKQCLNYNCKIEVKSVFTLTYFKHLVSSGYEKKDCYLQFLPENQKVKIGFIDESFHFHINFQDLNEVVKRIIN